MFAPASHAALASGQFVMPHILTRIMSWSTQPCSRSQKGSERGAGIGRQHETLADKKSVEARTAELGKVIVRSKAGFADGDALLRYPFDQFEGGLHAHVQGAQVAIVYANDASAGGQRAIQLRSGMNLHERLHFQLASESQQLAKQFVTERGDNQQKTIRVVCPRFPDLPRIEEEVLAQHGEFHGVSSVAEILQRTSEKFAFGQHGKHGGSRGFQALRQLDGMKWFPKNSF